MAILLKTLPSFVMSWASCTYASIFLFLHPNSLLPPLAVCEWSSIILTFVNDFCTNSRRGHHITLFIDLHYQEQSIHGGSVTPFTHFTQNPTWYQAVRIAKEVHGDVFAVIDHGWTLCIAAVCSSEI